MAAESEPASFCDGRYRVKRFLGEGGKLTADKLNAEGLAHLDFAIRELREMKMRPYLERALRHKGLLKA